jgi:hypothetical protein
MFSVITNIYNKRTKGPTLMEFFIATDTLNFFDNEIFDVCTTVDTAHIDTIFKFLPHTRQHGCIDILHCCNCLYYARMVFSLCGSLEYFARNARCTVTTDLLVWHSNTQNDFSPELPFSHYIHSHRLAAEMWTMMKNNFLGKQFFEVFLLPVQVS